MNSFHVLREQGVLMSFHENSFYIYRERNVSKMTVAILATFGQDVLVKTPEFSRSFCLLSSFWLKSQTK